MFGCCRKVSITDSTQDFSKDISGVARDINTISKDVQVTRDILTPHDTTDIIWPKDINHSRDIIYSSDSKTKDFSRGVTISRGTSRDSGIGEGTYSNLSSRNRNTSIELDTIITMDEESVTQYLLENKEFAKKWFKENAAKLGINLPEPSPNVQLPPLQEEKPSKARKFSSAIARNFKISKKFNDYLADKKKVSLLKVVKIAEKKRVLEGKTETEILQELIRDVTTELDLNRLCYKILVNVSILTKSDRGSVFLATGTPGNRMLASKLFDVSAERSMEDCLVNEENQIMVPFGVGIAGNVASSNSGINIMDCYKVKHCHFNFSLSF